MSSVWGAAPSLAKMKAMTKAGQKNLFKAAEFWYYFRVYVPYFGPVIFLIFMIAAITGYNTVEGHLVLGSSVSLIATIAVITSYVMIVPWRKHPSVLILYRAMTSMVFSVNIILNSISEDAGDARGFAFVTQLMLILGECWLTTIAVDLVHSLTNPFISYRYNLQRFTTYNLVFSFLLSIVFFFTATVRVPTSQSAGSKSKEQLIRRAFWGYYFAWILLMYAYQIWATIFAYNRLRKGLSSSFEIRKQCAYDTFKCLSVYAVYLSVLVLFFIILSSTPNSTDSTDTPIHTFGLVLLYFIGCRGAVDAIAWFMLHDFVRSDTITVPSTDPDADAVENPIQNNDDVEGGIRTAGRTEHDDDDGSEGRELFSSDAARGGSRNRTMSIAEIGETMKDLGKGVSKEVTKGISELAQAAVAEIDEADLSPQVNMALRQQVVQYVTLGVKEAITNITPPPIEKTILQELKEFLYPVNDFAAVEGMEVTEYILDNMHPFKSFAPQVFKSLREEEGINDSRYLKTLSSTANERLSEGASGAFMFFCGGGEFIVKTIRDREARVLHASLKKYSKYLKKNKNSLLCRFLGSYSLAMYEQTFYFVVMLNCFDHKAKINERYDIKGSWVNRSADHVKPSKKVVCRHCNEMFIPAAKEDCPVIVGRHEANVVLKDNDLRNRISLKYEDAKQVVSILKKDSDLLGELGVLDYSLLIGVKKGKFEIHGEGIAIPVSSVSSEIPRSNSSLSDSSRQLERRSMFLANQIIGPSIYHFGIVDFLQDWTFDKEMERNFKIYVNRKDPDGISVMEPIAYKLRFQSKMDQIFELDEESGASSISPKRPSFENIFDADEQKALLGNNSSREDSSSLSKVQNLSTVDEADEAVDV